MVGPGFTASLLRASHKGFAGLAAARMFEEAPELVESAGFDAWQSYLSRQLLALASAVEDQAPERFSAGVAWSRDAFVARAKHTESVALSLRCLEAVLAESLPLEAQAALPEHFLRARAELESAATLTRTQLDGSGPSHALVEAYLEALLAGDERRAMTSVREALDAGTLTVATLIDSVLVPAQRELGRRWHQGVLGAGEEHFVTQATRKVLALALALAPPARPRQRTVVVAAVAGNAHDLGLAFVAAHFELDGWRTLFLGGDTPVADLVSFVVRHQADLVALGATLEEQRTRTADAIRALRAARPALRILVGGAAYDGRSDLWSRSGADGYAASTLDAVKTALELVGS